MRSRVAILAFAIQGLAAGCGGSGLRTLGDASPDGNRAGEPGIDRGLPSAVEAGTQTDSPASVGGRLGVDATVATGGMTGTGASGGGGGSDASSAGAGGSGTTLPLPDSGVTATDTPSTSPDGSLDSRPDSSTAGDRSSELDTGATAVSDGGAIRDAPGMETDAQIADSAGRADVTVDTGTDTASMDLPAPLACNVPSCWADLMRDCQPAGGCVEQSAGANDNLCFSNGVKVLAVVDGPAQTMTTTVKSGAQTCYQLDWNLAGGSVPGAASTGVIKNGSGATVATISDDVSGYSVITCTGGQPVVIGEWCDITGGASCGTGTCTP